MRIASFVKIKVIVKLTSISQINTSVSLTLQIWEIVLNAPSETGSAPRTELFDLKVDRFVVQNTYNRHHCDRHEKEPQESLEAFQPHMPG